VSYGQAPGGYPAGAGPASNGHRPLIIAERDRYGAIDVGWTAPSAEYLLLGWTFM